VTESHNNQICVNGIKLYYEIIGKGTPILFIHGLGSSTRDWEYQIEYFSKNYKIIIFDLRGHGKSDKSVEPYSINLFAKDTAELINMLDIAPVYLVGISLGGMIALQLAINNPKLIRILVVINCGSEMVVRTIKDRLTVLQRFLIVRLLGMRKMGELLGSRLFPEAHQQKLRQKFVDRWSENDPQTYRKAMRAIIGWSVTDQLHWIKCPTLVITAENDYTPLEDKLAVVNKIKDAKLEIIKNSRHGSPADQPENFNKVLNNFLETQKES